MSPVEHVTPKSPGTRRVRIVSSCIAAGEPHAVGDILEVSRMEAATLVGSGRAIYAPDREAAMVEVQAEVAVPEEPKKRPGRPRKNPAPAASKRKAKK